MPKGTILIERKAFAAEHGWREFYGEDR